MYKSWKKAGVSLIAIAALLFLFAPFASAQERVAWGIPAKDIIGMDVKARYGEMAGKVEDLTLTNTGRAKDVIVGLAGTNREVAVPVRDFIFTHRDFVLYKGTIADLDRMTTVAYHNPEAGPVRGYYYSEEQPAYQNHGTGTGYWDTNLPRTPYFSYKRWLP